MKKDIFKEFLTNSLNEKQNLLLSNSLSDEDKELLQNQSDNLNAMIAKLDEMEDEVSNEVVEDLKSAVAEMASKLEAINEKLNQKNNETEENKEDMTNYLETKNALRDFASAIRNSKTAEEFKTNWMDCLVKNDVNPDSITVEAGSEDAFVPAAVKGMISDLWDKNSDWLRSLNYTGAARFYCRHNTSDQTAETSRAKGWKKGTEKARQDISVAAKLLEGQFIYKIVEIDLKTKFDSDEALINYVLGELVDQILYELKRAILVGDGRLDNDPYKITSIEALAKDTTDAYTLVSTASADFLVDDMRAMVDSIHNPNGKEIFVFMSKADLRTLARVQASETSTPVYMSTEQVAEQIGANRIITTDLLGSDFKAVAFIPSEYYVVGAPNPLSPILYSWHEGYLNKDVYRQETVFGSGINGLQSSACLLTA